MSSRQATRAHARAAEALGDCSSSQALRDVGESSTFFGWPPQTPRRHPRETCEKRGPQAKERMDGRGRWSGPVRTAVGPSNRLGAGRGSGVSSVRRLRRCRVPPPRPRGGGLRRCISGRRTVTSVCGLIGAADRAVRRSPGRAGDTTGEQRHVNADEAASPGG
jgi:hypothetical protein